MNMHRNLARIAAGASIVMFTTSSLALGQASGPITPKVTAEGTQYVTGGIGQRQQKAMQAIRQDYSLRLTFARPKSGNYLADIKVIIKNEKDDTVLDVTSPAPLLFVKLPAGTYQVMADFEGKQQIKKAIIKEGHPRGLVYYFDKM